MDKAELLNLTQWVRRHLLGLLEDIPDDKMCYQPFPGANHALWTVGHLTLSDLLGVAVFQGQPRDTASAFYQLFGEGSTPVSDTQVYPNRGIVLEFAEEARAKWIATIHAADATRLAEATPEALRALAPTYGAFIAGLVWHEGFHMGQLAVLRKALGLKPKFG